MRYFEILEFNFHCQGFFRNKLHHLVSAVCLGLDQTARHHSSGVGEDNKFWAIRL